jgi:argininosuccinate synthase
MAPVTLVEALGALAGEHGVGRADVVEDRLVGMKSRGVYETPAGTVLFQAHRELEQLVLDRRTLALADDLGRRYADLVYDGRWWTPEREALDALVTSTQRHVTGTVRMRLYKGSAQVLGRASPRSLYRKGLATFGADDGFRHSDSAGFIRLFGLTVRTAAERERRLAGRFAEAAD